MKKTYNKPELELETISIYDSILTSGDVGKSTIGDYNDIFGGIGE